MPAMWLSAPGEERTITKGRASAVGRGELYVTSSDLGSECGLGVPMLKGWPFGDRDGRGTT